MLITPSMRRVVRRATIAACVAAAATSTSARNASSQATARSVRPALVVLIVVDQMRGDYLDKFGSQFTGGLKRFHESSAFFPLAWQDHSNTETAPGHAALLSGREPVHTEIVSNNRGVPDVTATLVEAAGPGASPRRFNGTTLYDWMLARDSSARVLSVSRKDRGAILPIGRARGNIYWFADGKFTTSNYYADSLPTWVRAFDGKIPYGKLAGSTWNLLLPPNQYAEPDSVFGENSNDDVAFPHTLPDAFSLHSKLQQYPVMDSVTLAFALEGVHQTGVGQRSLEGADDAMPDLLSISLSTTDAIGHAYGPDSREIHDQVLHVDRWLGDFFAGLERTVPRDRIIYVLAADHGVAPMPEIHVAKTGHGGRVWLGDIVSGIAQQLDARYHTDFGFEFDNGLVYADVPALHARGINVDSLARVIVAAGVDRPGVSVGFTPSQLANSPDSVAVRWRRSLPPSLGWIAAFGAKTDYVWSSGKPTAEHGTPNALGLHIPIAFVGAGVVNGRYDRLARSVDIAPTLAMLLGIKPTETLDGSPLTEIVARRAAAQDRK